MLTNYFGNIVLQYYFRNVNRWLALFTADPTALASLADEVVGGSYTRQMWNTTSPGNKTVGNLYNLVFSNMPACTITHYALADAQYSGNLLVVFQLPTPLVVPSSMDLTIAPMETALTL